MADYNGAIRTAIESALRERDQLLEKLKEFEDSRSGWARSRHSLTKGGFSWG